MREEEFLAATVSSSRSLLIPDAEDEPAESGPPLVRGVHRVAYTEWGPRDARRTVVCAHGFSRNGRDFDVLADALAERFRVVCPDFPGRGRSGWLGDPSADAGYNIPQYVVDSLALIARLGVDRVDWVGTSMGGLVGMAIAAIPGSPVRRLVLNDIGYAVPRAFMADLAVYASRDPGFPDLDALEDYLRDIYPGFVLTEEQWRRLARHSFRRRPDGTFGLAWDPRIGRGVRPVEVDVRPVWERVRAEVLLLRGEHSAALSREVADEMTKTGPQALLVEIPGVGHAPMLMAPEQVALVETWLEAGQVH